MAIDFLQVGTSTNSLVTIPAPDGFSWGKQDVSSPDAGRTQDADATMQKMRITTKRKLQLSWKNRDEGAVAQILQAFEPEYVYVRYRDALTATFQTRQFYTGDMSVTMSKFSIGGATYSLLSFNVIER